MARLKRELGGVEAHSAETNFMERPDGALFIPTGAEGNGTQVPRVEVISFKGPLSKQEGALSVVLGGQGGSSPPPPRYYNPKTNGLWQKYPWYNS